MKKEINTDEENINENIIRLDNNLRKYFDLNLNINQKKHDINKFSLYDST